MINYAIRVSVINNVRNLNSRLCYWYDTHFRIEVLFQTSYFIILAIRIVNFINRYCIDMIFVTINIANLKYCYLLFQLVCARVCVWLKVLGLCISCARKFVLAGIACGFAGKHG